MKFSMTNRRIRRCCCGQNKFVFLLLQWWILKLDAVLSLQNNLYSTLACVARRRSFYVRRFNAQHKHFNWKDSILTGQHVSVLPVVVAVPVAVVVGTDVSLCQQELQENILVESDYYLSTKAGSVKNVMATDCRVVPTRTSCNSNNGVVVAGWMERLRQLREFYMIHGHTLVPKRFKNNPSLGNWVSKQRQQYHNFRSGTKPCSLTQARIDQLNQLNFCWNATFNNRQNDEMDDSEIVDEWWSHYRMLWTHCQHDDIHKIIRQSRIGMWLDRQRKVFDIQTNTRPNICQHSTDIDRDDTTKYFLTDDQLTALSRINEFWYMTRRQYQWEMRYRDLQTFAAQYGHCCVPISYSDKHLAHWVSNQRKLYNVRNAGKRSEMTTTRIQKLEEIGFVWNRWDYEFSKKGTFTSIYHSS